MDDVTTANVAASLTDEFETSTKIAQIFAGIFFTGIVLYMVFANSTKLSFIQQASQEKRLAVCCNIGIGVAAISAFLSFFQLTEVDNHLLPEQENAEYTVDLARPVEWILTCPLMQLVLVLMGGSRIPEYRRILMPMLSGIIVGFGSLALFVTGPFPVVCYCLGICTFGIMAFFNRLQILEHSNGAEGLFRGESEFRKATLILLMTWVPFPTWYALSPEGFNVIDNVLIIQMGWMLLNLIAKGSSILYVQRSKDNFIARLKVNKLMKGTSTAGEDENTYAKATLGPCVTETFTYLGMPDKADRFMRLLREAKLYTLDEVEALTPEECEKRKLPYDLISALQKRHRNWKLEVRDDAEEGIEKGENYYAIQNEADMTNSSDPNRRIFVKPPPPPPMGSPDNRQTNMMDQQIQQMMQSGKASSWVDEASTTHGPVSNEELLGKFTALEERLQALASLEEKMGSGFQNVCRDVEKNAMRCQNVIERGMQDFDRSLRDSLKLGNMVSPPQVSPPQTKSGPYPKSGRDGATGTTASTRSSPRAEDTSKFEAAFSDYEKRQQRVQEDIQSRLQLISQTAKNNETALKSLLSGSNTLMSNTVTTRGQQGTPDKTSTPTFANNSAPTRSALGPSGSPDLAAAVELSVSSWSNQVIAETRSCTFTLQARIAAVEEAVAKTLDDALESLAERVDDSMKSEIADQIKKDLDEHRKRTDDQIDKTVEKHVQVGVGILNNTLREFDGSILTSQTNTEGKIDQSKSAVIEQTESMFESLALVVRNESKTNKELNCTILEQAAASQVRAKECCEMIHNLSERIAPGSQVQTAYEYGVASRSMTMSSSPSRGGSKQPSFPGYSNQSSGQQHMNQPSNSPRQQRPNSAAHGGRRSSNTANIGNHQVSAATLSPPAPSGGV